MKPLIIAAFRLIPLALALSLTPGVPARSQTPAHSQIPPPSQTQAPARVPATKDKAPRTATHRVVIQITQNDPAIMTMALNNLENLVSFYEEKGEKVEVELVAYGAGLHMVRGDTSPVKDRLAAIGARAKNVTFSGCGNTLNTQSRQENQSVSLVPGARVVSSGIGRIVELQEQGWTYVRP